MGLDTSHGCWHGAYSAFARWRQKIAEVAGYAVWPVKHADGLTMDTIMLDWGHITEANLDGDWAETPTDPLIVLFAHKDCEGWINPPQALALADRLEEIMPLLPQEDAGGHIGLWREKTQTFIDGLRKAANAQECVDFH